MGCKHRQPERIHRLHTPRHLGQRRAGVAGRAFPVQLPRCAVSETHRFVVTVFSVRRRFTLGSRAIRMCMDARTCSPGAIREKGTPGHRTGDRSSSSGPLACRSHCEVCDRSGRVSGPVHLPSAQKAARGCPPFSGEPSPVKPLSPRLHPRRRLPGAGWTPRPRAPSRSRTVPAAEGPCPRPGTDALRPGRSRARGATG